MEKGIKRSCCPGCGAKIMVSELCQYALVHEIRKDGKISKQYKKEDDGSIDISIAGCEKACGVYWEADDFIIDEAGRFIDYKYTE